MSKPSSLPKNWLIHACLRASQWRLIVLSLLLAALPTVVVWGVSLWAFGKQLDYAPAAAHVAGESVAEVLALVNALRDGHGQAVVFSAVVSLLMSVALSPLLCGIAVTAARAREPLAMAELLRGGSAEYGRLARLLGLFWLPFLPVSLVAAGLIGAVRERSEQAVQYADVQPWTIVTVLIVVLGLIKAHIILESARADFALDTRRRSAFKALGRGLRTFWRRPWLSLGAWLAVSVVGLMPVAGLLLLRINLPHDAGVGLWLAALLMQAVLALMVWMRTARLFAMVSIARAEQIPMVLPRATG